MKKLITLSISIILCISIMLIIGCQDDNMSNDVVAISGQTRAVTPYEFDW